MNATATVLLLIHGWVFGPGLPETGVPVVFAETVPAEQCEVLAAISEGGITSRSFTIMGKPSCGHARDWAQLVKTANCTSTVYNDGTVKLARCEQ